MVWKGPSRKYFSSSSNRRLTEKVSCMTTFCLLMMLVTTRTFGRNKPWLSYLVSGRSLQKSLLNYVQKIKIFFLWLFSKNVQRCSINSSVLRSNLLKSFWILHRTLNCRQIFPGIMKRPSTQSEPSQISFRRSLDLGTILEVQDRAKVSRDTWTSTTSWTVSQRSTAIGKAPSAIEKKQLRNFLSGIRSSLRTFLFTNNTKIIFKPSLTSSKAIMYT